MLSPGASDPIAREAGFRYGAVFALTFVLLVFTIAVSDSSWARATAIGLEGLALMVVVGTSRGRLTARRNHATEVAVAGTVIVVLVGAGVIGDIATFAIGGLLAFAIPAALAGGVARLIRTRGVTLQAVLGALTIYLYVGLLFSWLIALVSEIGNTPYFAEGNVDHGDRVYFSFTVLTTTGFGDYTARTSVGHALAVVEMLAGQLYLVTVIGVLIGGFVGRARA